MAKSISFEVKPLAQAIRISPFALLMNIVVQGILFYALGFEAGLIILILSIVISSWIFGKRYQQAKENPISLDFEGIRYNPITSELGGDCLPWSDVREVDEFKMRKNNEKFVRVKLAPGQYYENWRELSLSNRIMEPCYLISAKLYNAEHEDMLYSFRSFHEKYGLKGVEYDSFESDPELGEASNLRLTIGAILGWGVILYSLITGSFPVGIGQAIYLETTPPVYWLLIGAFFTIANWCIWKINDRRVKSNQSAKK